jgi:predicted HAD superfamily phosphohydrolase YqeG
MRCHVCAGMCGVVGDEIMTDLMLLGGRRARQTRSVAMQTQTNNRNR